MNKRKKLFATFSSLALILSTALTPATAYATSSEQNINIYDDPISGQKVITGIGNSVTVSSLTTKLNEYCGDQTEATVNQNTVTVYDSEGNAMQDTDVVGTGCRVVVKNQALIETADATAVIFGDLNGDGAVDASDGLLYRQQLLGLSQLSGVYATAASASSGSQSGQNKTATAEGLLAIKHQILELSQINQAYSSEDPGLVTPIVNNLEDIKNSMLLMNESLPKGVPSTYTWYNKPTFSNSPSEDYPLITAWGQVYDDYLGNPAENTRVQLRRMHTYILTADTNEWVLCNTSDSLTGEWYSTTFQDGTQAYTPRDESDNGGGISCQLSEGYNFHFWNDGARGDMRTVGISNIKAIFVTCQARLIVDSQYEMDDRDKSRYLLGIGADYWCTEEDMVSGAVNNPCSMMGRFEYVTNDWKAFNAWWCADKTGDVISSYPPPME